jgi:cytidyltransferase-like protein
MDDAIIIVTGGFDPIHSGHIDYINSASTLGRVLVGVNSDDWLIRKKGSFFMPYEERANIVKNLKGVMGIIEFDDSDDTASDAITQARKLFIKNKLIFANGGDRTSTNIPEMNHSDNNLIFKFGVGGEDKKNSSSWILNEWKAPKTERPWGYYRVLHDVPGMKVKELTVNPNCNLSMQRHSNRSEHWVVDDGKARVYLLSDDKINYHKPIVNLEKHDSYDIAQGQWHQLRNPYDEPCRIVEIQYGKECSENDIERK